MQYQVKIVALAVVLSSISQLAVCTSTSCPELTADRICNLTETQFSFYDGCNTIICGETVNAVTLKACISMEENKCREYEMEIFERLADGLQCPNLTVSAVCKSAPSGFNFTDGCNNYTCSGDGTGQGTERVCPESEFNPAQLEICKSLTEMTFEQFTTDQCEVNTTDICLTNGPGFNFTDGCNTISCIGSEGLALTTLMACPPIAADSDACRLVQEEIAKSSQLSTSQYTCRSLSSESICNSVKSVDEFAYSDGCNRVICMQTGSAITSKFCPTDSEDDADSVEYCRLAGIKVQQARREALSST